MKNLYALSICLLLSFVACTNDNTYFQEDPDFNKETIVETTNLETCELSPELQFLFSSLFSKENAEKIITARFDFDKKSGDHIMTSRFETEYETLSMTPMLKSREEGSNNNEWVYWGDVCGLISAKKFVDFLEKKFKDEPYETRFEPISGKDCKKAYYRKG